MFRDPQSQASSATAQKKFPVQSARTVQPGPERERGERAGPRPSLGGTPSGAERRGGPGGGDPATTYLEFPVAWRLRLWCARDTPSRLHSGRRLRAGLRASISHRVSPTWPAGQPRPGTPLGGAAAPGQPGPPAATVPAGMGSAGCPEKGVGACRALRRVCPAGELRVLQPRTPGRGRVGCSAGSPAAPGRPEFLSFLLRGRSERWVGAHGGCWPGPAGQEGSPSRHHHHHHHPRESGLPLAIAGSSVGSGSAGGAAGSFSLFLGLAAEAARFGSARLAPGLERR